MTFGSHFKPLKPFNPKINYNVVSVLDPLGGAHVDHEPMTPKQQAERQKRRDEGLRRLFTRN